jgi:predicted 3-demethylubiquinone-9 3-methyltransferase (glyoxalase superfamily)
MQNLMTCLGFNDRAEEAVRFYTSVFPGSKILQITHWGDAGPGPKGAVLAISFELNGQRYLALNGGPPFTFTIGMSLVVRCDTQEEIDHYWRALSEGGEEGVCGWVTDRFGVSWQIVPAELDQLLADDAKSDRVMAAVMSMKKLDLAAMRRAAS